LIRRCNEAADGHRGMTPKESVVCGQPCVSEAARTGADCICGWDDGVAACINITSLADIKTPQNDVPNEHKFNSYLQRKTARDHK